MSNESKILLATLEEGIILGHQHALMLREQANVALAMHKSVGLVETPTQRNHRRFELEAFAEEVRHTNARVREAVRESLTEATHLLTLGKEMGSIIGVDDKLRQNFAELEGMIAKLRRINAEYDFIDLTVAAVEAQIAQMV